MHPKLLSGLFFLFFKQSHRNTFYAHFPHIVIHQSALTSKPHLTSSQSQIVVTTSNPTTTMLTKPFVASLLMAIGLGMQVIGVSTYEWISGTQTDPTDSRVILRLRVGLFRTEQDTLVLNSPAVTSTFDNQGSYLQAGEVAMSFIYSSIGASLYTLIMSLAIAYRKLPRHVLQSHTFSTWSSFIGGFCAICGSIGCKLGFHALCM
jgi:hypothetical protein